MLNIDNQNLCELCFAKLPPKMKKCPYCGGEKNIIKYPTSLPEGTILVGRYSVGKVLGKGGFGITYLCYDLKEKKKVAIKEYLPDTLAHRNSGETAVTTFNGEQEEVFKDGAEKFYEEAKLVSRFNGNPNIISVYEFFYENNTTYFVMEYLSGMDLKRYLKKRNGKISEEEALYILNHASDALLIVHSTNILHRDISPDNIFLCDDGSVKLIDFGAARQVLAEASQSLSVIIKHGFAPLEQYQRKGKQGPWSDIYALGSTIYLSVSGKMLDDAMSRLEDDEVNMKDISPDLSSVLLKMIALKREDRYQSIPELKKDLLSLNIEQTAPRIEKKAEKNFCDKCGTEIPLGETLCDKCAKSRKNIETKTDKRKNLISVGLSIALVVLFMSVFYLLQTWFMNESNERFDWSLNNGVLTVFCEGSMDEYNMTGNKSPWYKYRKDITTVIIEESVSQIGDNAFSDYDNINEVFINNTSDNISVSSTAFPEGAVVTYKSEYDKPGLYYDFLDGVLHIYGIGPMKDFKEGESPWANLSSEVEEIVIREGITNIGAYAFYNCYNLRSISIPDSVTSIGYRAFDSCKAISTIKFPESISIIGNYAFSDCYGLTVMTIPTSVKSIGDHAFSDCYFLGEIIIENNKNNISVGSSAIPKRTKITYSQWNLKNGVLTIIGNTPFEETEKENRPWRRFINSITSVEIKNGVTEIGEYEFKEYHSLEHVSLPETLTVIPEGAFSGCENLAEVSLPLSVSRIGDYAFFGCHSLTEIYISEYVEAIGKEAFSNCRNLITAKINNRKDNIEIGSNAFSVLVSIEYAR
ncbi:MAG: leucine-rich repeat protein [Clostridia bacterium]|nr:leucine-rich repeat protein [Clostridia bacterium]